VFRDTEQSTVKKVSLVQFARPRSNGKIALELNEDDRLIGVSLTDGVRDVMLLSEEGKAIRFSEEAVRPMSRTARGVRGIKMPTGVRLIALLILEEGKTILTATESGYGQRTHVKDYRPIGRGGQGVRAIQVTERNGKVIGATQVSSDDEVLLITSVGTMVRIRVKEVSVVGRNTQGVRLIQLAHGEQLVEIEAVLGESEHVSTI